LLKLVSKDTNIIKSGVLLEFYHMSMPWVKATQVSYNVLVLISIDITLD